MELLRYFFFGSMRGLCSCDKDPVILANTIPTKTSAMPIRWLEVKVSSRKRTAPRLLKMGIRFPNSIVRAAPIFRIAMFQIQKQMTEAPRPRYKMPIAKGIFQVIGFVLPNSKRKKGSSNNVPKENATNRKFMGEIPAGFFLTSVL
jgi:hypothetical protein